MQLGIGDHEGLTPLDLVIKDRLSHVNFHHSGNFCTTLLGRCTLSIKLVLVYD